MGQRDPAVPTTPHGEVSAEPRSESTPLAVIIDKSRLVILIAVASVLIVATVLFLLGAAVAVTSVVTVASTAVEQGVLISEETTLRLLKVVITMLEAVVFYLVGLGLYSMFIAPLELARALGVDTLDELEAKVISV